jgi:hypothetical protein
LGLLIHYGRENSSSHESYWRYHHSHTIPNPKSSSEPPHYVHVDYLGDDRSKLGEGKNETRYRQESLKDWSYQVLDAAIQKVHDKLSPEQQQERFVVLDIAIPTHRCDVEALQTLLAVPIPPKMETCIIVICDNPSHPNVNAIKNMIGNRRTHRRFIMNVKNEGAAFTRTRAFSESWADYILFLDDDVKPRERLLHEYEKMIRSNPKVISFAGVTIVPDPLNDETEPWRTSVKLLHMLHWWEISKHEDYPVWLFWTIGYHLVIHSRLCNNRSGPSQPIYW